MAALTASQRQAVEARGNVLVAAGAGTGKTSTLVRRCISLLLDTRCSLPEILMVTFTDAAASEMRGRVRSELQRARDEQTDPAAAEHLRHQLALLDAAPICTLHSFCLQLLRQHFFQLALDPAFVVLDDKKRAPLKTQTLERLFQGYYDGDTLKAEEVRELITRFGRGSPECIQGLVLRLHDYLQSLEDPDRWLKAQERIFQDEEPTAWRTWFLEAFPEWLAGWLPELRRFAGVPGIDHCLQLLAATPGRDPVEACEQVAETLRCVLEIRADTDKKLWPKGTKTPMQTHLRRFWSDAEFLRDALDPGGKPPALAQDWLWVREQICVLLRLTREFTAAFSRAKRELSGLDFSDLEQYALRLLRDPETGRPTPAARLWQERLRFIFVDEYQDINPAQDAILRALSREETEPNRFLVGDVKQSIYRFRRANPKIFREYERVWRECPKRGRRIPLADNFRSREAILQFVNALFAPLLRPSIGGVDYPPDAWLQFGAPAARAHLGADAPPPIPGETGCPRVELHLIDQADESGEDVREGDESPAGPDLLDLQAIEREARLVAHRLSEIKKAGRLVWDEPEQAFRPVAWRDMAVLLRSPTARVEAFAQEFNRLGVPLVAARAGFFESIEVRDLLSLLQLLDNPLQDLPLLAVLRSPLVALSLDELVEIRVHSREKPFWSALRKFHQSFKPAAGAPAAADLTCARPAAAWSKIHLFLSQYARWRELARQNSLSHCLEAVLAETHYEALLLAEARGEERAANVRRLLLQAREYDPYQRQGLYRFLRYVAMQEAEELEQPPAASQAEDAVRLSSIHAAKGLEYPVVVVAGLGANFNLQDLRQEVLLHERYGLCPVVKPPEADQSYPSLIHWLAAQEERRELLGQEMRLLYVALTRARDLLILTGAGHEPVWESVPAGPSAPAAPLLFPDSAPLTDHALLRARSSLDWLLLWLPRATAPSDWVGDREGANRLLRWRIYAANDAYLQVPSSGREAGATTPSEYDSELDEISRLKLAERLLWQYPYAAATSEPAIKRISELIQEAPLEDREQWLFSPEPTLDLAPPVSKSAGRARGLSAVDVGSAHHRFLELVSLEHVSRKQDLKAESDLMVADGSLTTEEASALDFDALLDFWTSKLGTRIRAHAPRVHREIPFTARLSPADLAALNLCEPAARLPGEYFVARGKADLAVMLPREIWLVDFKTDHATEAELPDLLQRYERQLKLYGLGLSRIYQRPVTERWLHFLALRRSILV